MHTDNIYKRFVNTINELGVYLINESEERISEIIFEDYPIDSLNLSDDVLSCLIYTGYIDQDIVYHSRTLKRLFDEIEIDKNIYTLEAFKAHPRWKELLELSDTIKGMLYL